MSGRKTIPADLHLLRGNPGKRPIPEQIEIEEEITAAPEWFSDEQRDAWNHVVENSPPSLLRILDASILAAHCIAVANFKEATLAIREEGFMSVSTKATKKRSDWFMIQAKAMEQIIKTSAEMGLTPASRSKVAASKGKAVNKFSDNGKRAASA